MLPPDSDNQLGALARTPQPLSDPLLSQSALTVASADYAPPASPDDDSSVTLSALFQSLRRRWPLALGLALVGALLVVGAVVVVLPAKYTAQTRLKVDSRGQRQIFGHYLNETEPTIWKGNQEAMIKSYEILNAALNNERVKNLEVAKGSPEWLEKAIKVDFLLGPEIMRLTLSGDRQDEVAPLLNAIVDEYLTSMDKEENARREKLLERLKGTQRLLKTQLEVKRAELRRVCQEQGVEDPEIARTRYSEAVQDLNQARKEYRDYKSDLDKKKRDIAAIQARLKTLDTEPVSPFVIDKYFQQSPLLQEHLKAIGEVNKLIGDYRRLLEPTQAKKKIDEALRERDSLLKDYEADCNQLRPEIERKIRAEIRDTLVTDVEKLKTQIDGGQELVKNQQRHVDDLEQAARQLNPSGGVTRPEVGKLTFEIEQLKDELKLVSGEVAKLNMEPMPASRVLRLQEAATPVGKDYSRQLKFGAVGGLGVFGLLLFGVAYWECRARRVNAATEVSQSLRMSVLGTLPALPRRSTGQLTKSSDARERQWQSLMTESIDAVRTLLLHAARTDALQVVMVTSAGDGEGKTSLASQLAASLARAWRKTLLVDGDLRNPAVHKLFDVPQEPGFSEVLRGEVIQSDVIRPTPLSRLWIMPAGRWDSHALQALAQEEVHKLFAELKDSYDFIVVDSCPVLPVTDSLLLGQHVDAVIFSILRNVSRMPAVQAAQKRLQALGIRTFGAVVLGADGEVSGRSYQFPGQLVG